MYTIDFHGLQVMNILYSIVKQNETMLRWHSLLFVCFCGFSCFCFVFKWVEKEVGSVLFSPTYMRANWASEASPTLGCSIEISRDICIYVGMSRMSN